MVKQSLKSQSNGIQSTEKQGMKYPIIKDKKITARQLREKIFEKINAKKRAVGISKHSKCCRLIDGRQCSEIKSLIRQEQVTCSICLDVMVGPVLVECGHVFCLTCIQSAFLASQQCPLCRKAIEEDVFKVSTQAQTIIALFNSKNMNEVEKRTYQQRQITLISNQAKRKIPCDLQIGDFVDINLNNKWKQGKVQEIEEGQITVTMEDQRSKSSVTVYLNISSRRLARHRTFTKAPPLMPIYFSKDINLRQPFLQYIVERPSFYHRSSIYRVENQDIPIQETTRPDWDQFENIPNRNNWIFQDEIRVASENIWNPSLEDLQQPFLI